MIVKSFVAHVIVVLGRGNGLGAHVFTRVVIHSLGSVNFRDVEAV